jgi:hypothetical protein
MATELTTQVLDSLFHKGDDWSLFEIQVHARVWGIDPFLVRDEVLKLVEEGLLQAFDSGSTIRISGWTPTTPAPVETLQEDEDALQSGCASEVASIG